MRVPNLVKNKAYLLLEIGFVSDLGAAAFWTVRAEFSLIIY